MSQHYDNSATINVQLISIHAPREGRDLHGLRLLLGRDISIHAPRAGRDLYPMPDLLKFRHFNPRAPCGARRNQRLESELLAPFQSTRPVRGATNHSFIISA